MVPTAEQDFDKFKAAWLEYDSRAQAAANAGRGGSALHRALSAVVDLSTAWFEIARSSAEKSTAVSMGWDCLADTRLKLGGEDGAWTRPAALSLCGRSLQLLNATIEKMEKLRPQLTALLDAAAAVDKTLLDLHRAAAFSGRQQLIRFELYAVRFELDSTSAADGPEGEVVRGCVDIATAATERGPDPPSDDPDVHFSLMTFDLKDLMATSDRDRRRFLLWSLFKGAGKIADQMTSQPLSYTPSNLKNVVEIHMKMTNVLNHLPPECGPSYSQLVHAAQGYVVACARESLKPPSPCGARPSMHRKRREDLSHVMSAIQRICELAVDDRSTTITFDQRQEENAIFDALSSLYAEFERADCVCTPAQCYALSQLVLRLLVVFRDEDAKLVHNALFYLRDDAFSALLRRDGDSNLAEHQLVEFNLAVISLLDHSIRDREHEYAWKVVKPCWDLVTAVMSEAHSRSANVAPTLASMAALIESIPHTALHKFATLFGPPQSGHIACERVARGANKLATEIINANSTFSADQITRMRHIQRNLDEAVFRMKFPRSNEFGVGARSRHQRTRVLNDAF